MRSVPCASALMGPPIEAETLVQDTGNDAATPWRNSALA
jgi:hypothetical protein